jgi:hypothetical protein|tara:strand:- start:2447 stop:2617 length:171 start_codon:yes stop_codon:yes gene_type:complete
MEKQTIVDNNIMKIESLQSEGLTHWHLTHATTGNKKIFEGTESFVQALIETGMLSK